MLIEISNFSISEIKNFSSLKCKHKELLNYLSKYALSHSKKGLFKTYILKIENKIIGYISFSMATVEINPKIHEITTISKNLKYNLPALKITRLCIFEEYQKQGFGSIFITFSEILAIVLQMQIGCKMLLVDAKIDAQNFYIKNGFLEVTKENGTIFMIKKVITPNEFKNMEDKEEYLNNIEEFCNIFNYSNFYYQIREYLKY